MRDRYAVASDGGDFARYLAGEDLPDAARKNAWLDELRADAAAGKRWQWVHVVHAPLSDYLRYAFEWGYAINIRAGADVRILDLAEHPRPVGLPDEDFWLLDDQAVLTMRYGDAGSSLAPSPSARPNWPGTVAPATLPGTPLQPFAAYWARHPGYHRRARVA